MRLNKPCILLIVISGMERFAFKGVASNLVTYLTEVMKMRNSSAAKFVNSWVGLTWIMPLLVATIADSYWDRHFTILASSILYAAGLLALTSTALPWPWIQLNKISSIASLSWSLCLISLGQGGYNPSLQAFGAEQLEDDDELPQTNNNDNDEQNSDKKSLFFQWWYFGVCCGSLLGVVIMSYIQDTIGWGLGFAIPTLVMIVSILMFLCGNRFYMDKDDTKKDKKSFGEIFEAVKANILKMFNGWKAFSRNDYALVELELEDCNKDSDKETASFETNPKQRVQPLEAFKIVLRLLPIWLMLLMFAVIFQQPATFFTKQGMTMKRNIGSKFKIPPAALQSAVTVSIIVLMPFYDKFFVPTVRVLTQNEKGLTVLQRIGVGMFISVAALIIAALTERKRLDISRNLGVKSDQEVPFSIFWLLPQYILLGISDIFTVVGMQEFFYSEVPERMRTMGIALYASVFGVGSFLSALLISVIEYLTGCEEQENGWFADDMNEARLDNYYWFLAFSSLVSWIAFVGFCKIFTSRR